MGRDEANSTAERYVSARTRRPRPASRMQPPLTPMIDVVFLLLAFFIMTMHFGRPEGRLPAGLPRVEGERAETLAPLETLYVTLRRSTTDGGADIEVSRHPTVITGAGELYEILRRRRERFGPEVPVVIRSDGLVPWGDTLNAYYQARRARFENIALASPR